MEDFPKRNSSRNSDLPKPKKRPASPRSGKTSANRNYGSDTMQFTAPIYEEGYEEGYTQRHGSAQQPHRNPQQPRPSQPRPQRSQQRQQTPPRRSQQRPPEPPPKKKRRRKKKTSFLGRLLRNIAIFAAVLFFLYSAAALFMIGKLEKLSGGERTVTSGALDASYVTSILLIGTDARDVQTERGRSDSMIMVSLNSRTNTMYLTSFMRDAYVEIPGHGNAKLNAAYSYGGAELLMDTLELNYGVSIDNYMSVSFAGFAGVIDAFGGVEITLSDAEAQAVNEILISEVNELMGDAREADLLQGGGTYELNGKQALSYSRIRYVGNADFERTSRQREVMTQLFANLKTRAAAALPELVSSALPHLATNMSTANLYFLSLRAPTILGYEIQQIQVPAEGTWSGQTIDGQSVLTVNFEENTRILQESVYAASES